jgi:hypothetical protein
MLEGTKGFLTPLDHHTRVWREVFNRWDRGKCKMGFLYQDLFDHKYSWIPNPLTINVLKALFVGPIEQMLRENNP